jgi:hypothetical protein
MNYEVRAIFYEGGDEPEDSEEGLLVATFEADSIENARALAQASIEEAIRFQFSKVFRVYRLPSRALACEIVRPAAYEVDGLYDAGHGSQEHQIFDAFDAKDDTEARHKLLERSAGGLAAGYRGSLGGVVQLYRVPFHHETAKPFADREREFLGNIDITAKAEQAG